MSNLNKLMNLILEEPCILITDEDTKMMILSELDFIADITFKSVSEAENDLLGYYDDICVYLIKHELNLKYDRAKLIYDSLRIGDILNDPKTSDLREKLKGYYHKGKKYNKRIVLATKSSRLLDYCLKDIPYTKFEYEKNNNVLGFKYNDIISEVEALANRISKIYKENNLSSFDDFAIYIGDSEYLGVILSVFGFYGIPVSYNAKSSLYSISKIKELIDNLDIDSIDLSSIRNDEVRNAFVKAYNKLVEIDFTKDDLIDELTNSVIKKETKGIVVRPASAINSMYKYTFIVGFTFKNIPIIHKDDLYYNDSVLESININPSFIENKKEKEYFINSLFSMNEVYISYSINGIKNKYVESDLLDGLVNFEMDDEYKFKYSIERANLDYNKSFERKLLTGEANPYLGFYLKKFGRIPNFDSSYKNINPKIVSDILLKDGNMFLSYSRLEKYYGCPFSFYCNYILGLSVYKNTVDVGNVLHLFLEKYLNDKNYTLDMAIDEYNKEIKGEKFLLREPYKSKFEKYLKRLIEEIESENVDFNLKLIGTEVEKQKELKEDPSIVLVGKIDKVMEHDGKVVIFDYKSGSKINLSLDPSKDEDNKNSDYYKKYQLFIYLLFLDVNYESFAGVFYQRIMPKNKEDIKLFEDGKLFKPYGYKDVFSVFPYQLQGNKKDSGKISKDQFDKVMNDTKDLILNYKTNVLNAKFDIKPLSGNCKFCNYKSICYYSFKEDGDLDE